jgi:hypothetical protein
MSENTGNEETGDIYLQNQSDSLRGKAISFDREPYDQE